MENDNVKMKRRKTPWLLGTLMVASLATLVILQSTSLWKEFTIDSSSDLILLYTLSSLNFIAFIIFGFIFLRSIIKLMRERRTFELGAQIKTRLLIYFAAVSLLPIIAMAVFSYLFLNRALERWFTQIPENVVRQTREIQKQSVADRIAKLQSTTKMMAAVIEDDPATNDELERIAVAGNLSHIEIRAADKTVSARFEKPLVANQKAELDRLLSLARNEGSAEELRDGKGFDVAIAAMSGGRQLVVVPDQFADENVSQIVDGSMAEFERLKQKQVVVRQVGLLTLGVLTFLLIFASSWVAFDVARGITTPIKALAEGANEIARGNLQHRVDVIAEDELALLVLVFNDMSAKLESNSVELGERRKYIETLLETLPTGVISVDAEDRVSTINRAAVNILNLDGKDFFDVPLDDLISEESRLVFKRLAGRARRVGHASGQTTISHVVTNGNTGPENELTIAITATKLPSEGGVVLVIEDLSELIAAQRASAWQEVARRMAHEIKNPLTPIQLSAERLARRFTKTGHVDNGVGKRIDDKGPIGDVVHESTATILREVTSLKTMVDEFSRFARLPDTKLENGDLNAVIDQAVAVFDTSIKGVEFDTAFADDLPQVNIDAEQMKSVFVNLIGNAVEAFDDSTDQRTIWITTRHDAARDLVVAEVSDNGKGIAPVDIQKLFQPYFSTKGRGTGLGLAIVNRIITEHQGRIKAAANQPKGAKFIVELPANT